MKLIKSIDFNVKDIDKHRLENVNKISNMASKLFNAARIYKN